MKKIATLSVSILVLTIFATHIQARSFQRNVNTLFGKINEYMIYAENDAIIIDKTNASHTPYKSNNKIFVPFRAFAESIGAEIIWQNYSIIIDYEGHLKTLKITKSTSELVTDSDAISIKMQFHGGRTYIEANDFIKVFPKYHFYIYDDILFYSIAEPKLPDIEFARSKYYSLKMVIYKDNDLFGYKSEDGTIMIPSQYITARDFSYGLAPVNADNSDTFMNYINENGEVVFNRKYRLAYAFGENGLAPVATSTVAPNGADAFSYGFIDRLGNEIIPVQHDGFGEGSLKSFSDGYTLLISNDKYTFFDRWGDMLQTANYDTMRNFSEGFAVVSITNEDANLYGFIDTQGKEIIKPQYKSAHDFIGESAIVDLFDERKALVNRNNNILFTCDDYKSLTYLADEKNSNFQIKPKEDSLLIFKSNNQYGLIERNGNIIIPADYLSISTKSFRNQLHLQSLTNQYIYNTVTKKLFDLENKNLYDEIGYEDSNMINVKFKSKKWGFINEQGEILIEVQFDDAKSFSEGFSAVKINDSWGVIDQTGKTIIPFIYENIDYFTDGYITANTKDGAIVFLNRDGEVVDRAMVTQYILD